MIGNRLTNRLVIVTVIAMGVVLLTQVGLRLYVELPQLYELERISDLRSVDRAERVIEGRIARLAENATDYAVWDSTYRYAGGETTGKEARHYLESEIGYTAFEGNDINGVLIFDTGGKLLYEAHFDVATGKSPPGLALDPASLHMDELLAGMRVPGTKLIDTGIAHSNIGNIMFAASSILDTESERPPRGIFIFWRLIDESVVRKLNFLVDRKMKFIPIAYARDHTEYAGRVASLINGNGRFLPRDGSGYLYWLVNDAWGRPAYLVRQDAGPRMFNDHLISLSSGVGFAATALVLLVIAVYFSRSVIRRVMSAADTMRRVWRTGDYSSRIPVAGNDELTEMSLLFNEMLKKIEFQEQELREQNRELEEISQKDALTGIPNRRYFDQVFDRAWRQAARSSRPLSLLLIDVDHFKAYNDHYGHQNGDHALKRVAGALRDNLQRAADFVARYGGEEFCVILMDTEPDAAVQVAESLRIAVRDLNLRHDYAGGNGIITISIGVSSTIPHPRDSQLDLVKQADRALYAAKAAGRNRVRA